MSKREAWFFVAGMLWIETSAVSRSILNGWPLDLAAANLLVTLVFGAVVIRWGPRVYRRLAATRP